MNSDSLSFYETKTLAGTVDVIGIPIDIGKDAAGTAEAPKYLRSQGLLKMLAALGFNVNDLGDLDCPQNGESLIKGDKNCKYLEAIAKISEEVAALIASSVKAGHKVVALGGDHSMSLGTISGAAAGTEDELGVIWIDAHGDMNTPETTLSGNIHGMPAAALMGFGHPRLVNILRPGAKVKPANWLFIGLKDLDQTEIDLIRREKLEAVTMLDLATHGLHQVTEKIKALASRVKNIWVSVDIDAIDKEYAPATLMSTAGGLTYREITLIAKYIGRLCPVVGLDIAEQVVTKDIDAKTAKLVFELISNLLGSEYSWYTEYMNAEAKKQAERS
ncbi:MAG: arginase [Candidatus Magasanikbacteria bacterium]|nr:arginase [Candidatus Magasanikbacteria bacterium]